MRSARSGLSAILGRQLGRKPFHGLASRYLARRFPFRSRRRMCIYYESDAISMTQIYPFLLYEREISAACDMDIRCIPVARLLDGEIPREADVSLLQAWFTVDGDALQAAAERLRQRSGRVGFIDAFAHNDLRLARHLGSNVDFYLKKSLFRDRSLYYRPFRGDTNLTEFYQQLYDLPGEPVDWQVPEGFTDRLRLSPNFFTAPRLLHSFETQSPPDPDSKNVDLHARLGLGPDNGSWYRRMREDALARVDALSDRMAVACRGRVERSQYMAELRASKLCFSPFGYGELCWRDIEAILAGAVLIKPDMGHLETLPDLYEPGVTYLPVRWDFADLEDVVYNALAEPSRCLQIAQAALNRIQSYLSGRRFVADFSSQLAISRDIMEI